VRPSPEDPKGLIVVLVRRNIATVSEQERINLRNAMLALDTRFYPRAPAFSHNVRFIRG